MAGRRVRRFLLLLGVFLLCTLLGTTAGMVAGYLRTAPSLEEIEFDPALTTYIFDTNGQVIARLYQQNRVWVDLEDIPQYLRDAVVAIEDHRFYRHYGIDPLRMVGALAANLRAGEIVQGGSTITQQLAGVAFLGRERTFSRKLQDIIWAIQIERKYTKQEILERYLNEIYLGEGAYGVEAAAQAYFGKSVAELTLAEAALIAGLPRAPNYYNPRANPRAAVERRNLVLAKMAEYGYIPEEQARAAQREPLHLAEQHPFRQTRAPEFVDYVVAQLRGLGFSEQELRSGGLRVYTTLDLNLQEKAESVVRKAMERVPGYRDEQGLAQPQAALVAVQPQTGFIRAMVGGRGEPNNRFNRAVQAVRQPGSAMKPFVYIAALERGYTPATVIDDEPTQFTLPTGQVWAPENYDGRFRGPVTLRDAVEQSINVVAARVLHQVGVEAALEVARKMGISTLVEQGPRNDVTPAFALGGLTRGVTPLEMASAYGVLANGGIRLPPTAILRVTDTQGRVLYRHQPEPQLVLSEQTAYLATDLLQGVILRGTGKQAYIGRPAAGKTGTTSDNTDAWFVGYVPDLATAVWIGNDVPRGQGHRPMPIGSWFAAQVWGDFMREATAGTPVAAFSKPPGIVEGVRIDIRNGLLASAACPGEFVRAEVFVEGTTPTRFSPCGSPLVNLPGVLNRPQVDPGDSMPPFPRAAQAEGPHVGVARQQGMDGPP